MMEFLLQLDKQVFWLINTGMQNPVCDLLCPIFRERIVWLPVYLGILVFILINLKKKGWILILALILCAGVADTVSSKIVKPGIQRLRPCNDPEQRSQVRLLVSCGSGYSFTSSHAANHFAFAYFFFLFLGRKYRRVGFLLLFWAALIAISQVYVGVHYPLDILCGAGLGLLIAAVSFFVFKRTLALTGKP